MRCQNDDLLRGPGGSKTLDTSPIYPIQALSTALNLYRLDNFAYPSTDQGLQALVQKPNGTPGSASVYSTRRFGMP